MHEVTTQLWMVAGLGVAAIWIWRLIDAAIGIRQVPELTDLQWDRSLTAKPFISVIVPARNEEEMIEAGLRSLLAQDYANLEIIAVNDRSEEATGEIIDRVAAESEGKLSGIHIQELPPQWLGKTHAMWRAAQQARGEWLLFTDADVIFRHDALRRAMACVQSQPTDHFILFPTIVLKSAGERMIAALLQAFFFFGYRAWKLPNARARDYMGVGAFNLVRREAYAKVGTFEAMRMEVVEDMKLGKLIKHQGFVQRAAFGRDLLRIRWAHGTLGMMRNLTKNFFAAVQFSLWRVVGGCMLIALLMLGPYIGVAFAPLLAKLGYAVALLAILLMYVGMSRKSDIPWYYFLLHPIGTALFMYTIIRSTFVTLWRGGVTWRGTTYPLAELKKGLV